MSQSGVKNVLKVLEPLVLGTWYPTGFVFFIDIDDFDEFMDYVQAHDWDIDFIVEIYNSQTKLLFCSHLWFWAKSFEHNFLMACFLKKLLVVTVLLLTS